MYFNHLSGVTFKEGAGDECAAAVALVLFGNSDTILPGGYAGEEISENSPINQVTEFPQELVLLGKFIYKGEIKTERGELSILNWYLFDRYSVINIHLPVSSSFLISYRIYQLLRSRFSSHYNFALFQKSGRATVMIRGIANRLGLPWGLCDRWSLEAREALGKFSQ